MIEKEYKEYEISSRKYYILMLFLVVVAIISTVAIVKIESDYRYFLVFIDFSIFMLVLFLRQNFQRAYYWKKKTKLSRLIFLEIKGDYIPVRYHLSHLYFYGEVFTGIILYLVLLNSKAIQQVDYGKTTLFLCITFILIPMVSFFTFEVYEDWKCNQEINKDE